jgi:hypothetical protein
VKRESRERPCGIHRRTTGVMQVGDSRPIPAHGRFMCGRRCRLGLIAKDRQPAVVKTSARAYDDFELTLQELETVSAGRKAGANQLEYFPIKLRDVTISSVSH